MGTRRRRGRGRWLLPWLVVALAAYLGSRRMAPLPEQVRRILMAVLQEKGGPPLTIEAMRGNLWGEVRLEGVALQSPRGETLFQTQALRLRYNLWAMLRHRQRPERHLYTIELEAPSLFLERLPDGKWNLEGLFPRRPARPPAFRGLLRIVNGSLRIRDHLQRRSDGSPAEVNLRRVWLVADFREEGKVQMRGGGEGEPFPRRWRFQAEASPAPRSFQGHFRFEPSSLEGLEPWLAQGGKVEGASGTVWGEVQWNWREKPPRREYGVRLHLRQVGLRLKGLSLPLSGLNGEVRVAEGEGFTPGLRGELGPHRFLLGRSWIRWEKPLRFELRLLQAHLLPQALLPLLPKAQRSAFLLQGQRPIAVRHLFVGQEGRWLRLAGEVEAFSLGLLLPEPPSHLPRAWKVQGRWRFDLEREGERRGAAAWSGFVETLGATLEPLSGPPLRWAGGMEGREGTWRWSSLRGAVGRMAWEATGWVRLAPPMKGEVRLHVPRWSQWPFWPGNWAVEGEGGLRLHLQGEQGRVKVEGEGQFPARWASPRFAVRGGRWALSVEGWGREPQGWRGWARVEGATFFTAALGKPLRIEQARVALAQGRLSFSPAEGRIGSSPLTVRGWLTLEKRPRFDLAVRSATWSLEDVHRILPKEMRSWQAAPMGIHLRLQGGPKDWEAQGSILLPALSTPPVSIAQGEGEFHLKAWPEGRPFPVQGWLRLQRGMVQWHGEAKEALPPLRLVGVEWAQEPTKFLLAATELATPHSTLKGVRFQGGRWLKEGPQWWKMEVQEVSLNAEEVEALLKARPRWPQVEGTGRLRGWLAAEGSPQRVDVEGWFAAQGPWRWREVVLEEGEFVLNLALQRVRDHWEPQGDAWLRQGRFSSPRWPMPLLAEGARLTFLGAELRLEAESLIAGRQRLTNLRTRWWDWWERGKAFGEAQAEFALVPAEAKQWFPQAKGWEELEGEGVWRGRLWVEGLPGRPRFEAEGEAAPLRWRQVRLEGGRWRLRGWLLPPAEEGEGWTVMLAGLAERMGLGWGDGETVEVEGARWLAGPGWLEWRGAQVRRGASHVRCRGRLAWASSTAEVEMEEAHLRPEDLWAALPETWRPQGWELGGEGAWEGKAMLLWQGEQGRLEGSLQGEGGHWHTPQGSAELAQGHLEGTLLWGKEVGFSLQGRLGLQRVNLRPLLPKEWREKAEPIAEVSLAGEVQGTPKHLWGEGEVVARQVGVGEVRWSLLHLRGQWRGQQGRWEVVRSEGPAGRLKGEVGMHWGGEDLVWLVQGLWEGLPLATLGSVLGEGWQGSGRARLWARAEAKGLPRHWERWSHGEWALLGEGLAWQGESLGRLEARGDWDGFSLRLKKAFWEAPWGRGFAQGEADRYWRRMRLRWALAGVDVPEALARCRRWFPQWEKRKDFLEATWGLLAAQGEVEGMWDLPSLQGHVQVVEGAIAGWPFQALAAEVAWDRWEVQVPWMEVAHEGYFLSGSFRLGHLERGAEKGDLFAVLSLENLNVERLTSGRASWEPLRGWVSGRLLLRGSPTAPQGEAFLLWEEPGYGPWEAESWEGRVIIEPERLRLERTALRRGGSQVEVEGELLRWREKPEWKVRWAARSLRWEEVAPLLPAFLEGQGELAGEGELQGPWGKEEVTVHLRAKSLTVAGTPLRDVVLLLRHSPEATTISSVHLRAFGGEVEARGKLQWQEGRWRWDEVHLNQVDMEALSRFLLHLSRPHRGEQRPWQRRLARWLASLPLPLQGRAEVEAQLAGSWKAPEGKVLAWVREGKVQGRPLPPLRMEVALGEAWSEEQARRPGKDVPEGSVVLEGGVIWGKALGARVQGNRLALTLLNPWLPWEKWRPWLAVGEGCEGEASFLLWAVGDWGRPRIGFEVEVGPGRVGSVALGALRAEGEYAMGQRLRLASLRWEHPAFALEADATLPLLEEVGRIHPAKPLEAHLQVALEDAEPLVPLFPWLKAWKGQGELQLHWSGSLQEPRLEGEGQGEWSEVQLRGWPQPLQQVRGAWACRTTPEGSTLVRLKDWTSRWGDGKIELDGEVELRSLEPERWLTNPARLVVQGTNLAGRWPPWLEVKDAHGVVRTEPQPWGNRVVVEVSIGHLNGGRASLQGEVRLTQGSWRRWGHNGWRLNAQMDRVGVRVPPLVQGEVLADLTLTSTPRREVPLLLTGTVLWQQTSLGLPLRLASRPAKPLEVPDFPTLDVEMLTGPGVMVRSRFPEVEAPLAAALRCNGTPATLRLQGEAFLPRGYMRLSTLTGRYEIEQGRGEVRLVYFPRQARWEPWANLQMAARTHLPDPHRREGYRVRLQMEGSLRPGLEGTVESHWRVNATSEPPLPEEELLARLTRKEEVLAALREGRAGAFLESELRQMAVHAVSQLALRDVERLIEEGLALTRFRIDYELYQPVRLEAEAEVIRNLRLTYITLVGRGPERRYDLRLDYEVGGQWRVGYQTNERGDEQLNLQGVVQFH